MEMTNGLLFIYWIFFLVCLVSAFFCIKKSRKKSRALSWTVMLNEMEKDISSKESYVYKKVKIYFLRFFIISIIWFILTIFQNDHTIDFRIDMSVACYHIIFLILFLLIILILCKKKFKIICIFLFILGVCIIVFWWGLDKYLNWKSENLAYDPGCWYKEYQHNKEIWECNDKCEIVDWYSEHAFYQRYLDKYWGKPVQNCYKTMRSFGESVCLDFEYPRDFSYKYTWYNEWINEEFPSYVEKIKEYNRCIRKCWPMVEQPMCLG